MDSSVLDMFGSCLGPTGAMCFPSLHIKMEWIKVETEGHEQRNYFTSVRNNIVSPQSLYARNAGNIYKKTPEKARRLSIAGCDAEPVLKLLLPAESIPYQWYSHEEDGHGFAIWRYAHDEMGGQRLLNLLVTLVWKTDWPLRLYPLD
ncbi:hypothetical protein TNCV_3893121 [Trichonephila clavipes]|nr:hypothetical protein TNCV_3893121 [Trichonephila clavipes]